MSEDNTVTMFEYNGVNYKLRYDIDRIQIIETLIKKPLVAVMQQGALSINELMILISYGAIKENANAYEPPKKAMLMVKEMLREAGSYGTLSDLVSEALERDCPFFFQAG